MKTVSEKIKDSKGELKEKLSVSNDFALPKIEKIVVSTGVGSTSDKEKLKVIPDRLAKITGQTPRKVVAKKSIATFKLREGDLSGFSVTLRGNRMYSFLDKLINVAIPRERDFRGIKESAVDGMGNLTIGVKEHTIFPETSDEELRNVFGFGVTIVTTATNREDALTFFKAIGIPFKK